MSAMDGESPPEKPIGNSVEVNIQKSNGTLDWDIPLAEYAVQQAQIAQKNIESAVENAIEVTRSRVDRILTTSSAHFNQTVDSLQDLKSEYITYEDIAFGKIKEGFLYAYSRPLITTGTRRFLSYNTRRLFFSEETLLSRADAKVKELRQSIDLLKAESETLEKKALQAEEDLVRGRTKLRQAGKQIQGVINSAYKIERHASGLKDVLRELPSRDASRFRTQVTNLAKEAKKERNAMSKEVTKISNYGISI
ncbi:hypothetical protein CASFOL_031185 [Castilleja foliolosa]|uniref:Uncharacterized protein n=1 Tax=Castilleja foliolosa TaxID=1961234 RepID=A0ABD3C4Q3_9LAMI